MVQRRTATTGGLALTGGFSFVGSSATGSAPSSGLDGWHHAPPSGDVSGVPDPDPRVMDGPPPAPGRRSRPRGDVRPVPDSPRPARVPSCRGGAALADGCGSIGTVVDGARITVFLLDDHEIVRGASATCWKPKPTSWSSARPRPRTRPYGRSRARPRCRGARRPAGGRQRHRGMPGDPVPQSANGVPDADVVRRRRGAVPGHHGRRLGLRAQADPHHTTSSTPSAGWRPGRTSSIRR